MERFQSSEQDHSFSFDVRGRSHLVSTIQFDETRLVADGTHYIVVAHDFSDPSGTEEELRYELSIDDDTDDADDMNDGKDGEE